MRSDSLMPWVLLVVFFFVSASALASAKGTAPKPHGGRWGKSYFPNVPLITHEGKKVRFFDDLIKDKVVMINFIYTSCPDTCPLETARLAEVQRILGDRVGKDVFMYSISIDPEVDTPEVLKAYAERYKVGPGWTFLTGDEADITLLRKRLGLYIAEIQDGSNDHNLSLIIGNQASGIWKKSSPFENPYILATQVGGWLSNFKLASRNPTSYDNAPELRKISKGESLFRTRCTACHNIGKGDGQQKVGPNLLGVVKRRERSWIVRWLKEPEKVLAEHDPIATGLFIAYNYVPMPNMRLNKLEVDKLIEYLDIESRRVEQMEPVAANSHEASGAPKPCCKKRKQQALRASRTLDSETKADVPPTEPCCKKMQSLVLSANDTPDSDDETTIVAGGAPEKKSKTPDPVASTFRDAKVGERQEPIARSSTNIAPQLPSQRGGPFRMSIVFSFGLGCALFLLAAILRRSPPVGYQP